MGFKIEPKNLLLFMPLVLPWLRFPGTNDSWLAYLPSKIEISFIHVFLSHSFFPSCLPSLFSSSLFPLSPVPPGPPSPAPSPGEAHFRLGTPSSASLIEGWTGSLENLTESAVQLWSFPVSEARMRWSHIARTLKGLAKAHVKSSLEEDNIVWTFKLLL